MVPHTTEYPHLEILRQGIEYRFPVKCRGLTLHMRPLSVMEEDKVSQAVISELHSLPEQNRTSLKQSALLSIKKLALAQTSDVHSKQPLMYEAELQMMTAGELQFLFKEYVAGCDRVNPRLEQFTKAEIQGWVDTLKKNTQDQETTLIESSFYQLVALCRHLLTTEESPTGSLPG